MAHSTILSAGGRQACLGAGASTPYMLRAEFQAASGHGTIDTGRYEDTWISATEWKREAWFGSSHLVRTQSEDKHYVLSEGPEAGLLRLVMMVVEPIPAADTMTRVRLANPARYNRRHKDNQGLQRARGPER